MASRRSFTHRVVVLGNDGECRCEEIRSPWGGRTTHLRSQCSPETVAEPALGEEIVPAL